MPRRNRIVRLCVVSALLVAGLGLVEKTPSAASCAGYRLEAEQGGATLTPTPAPTGAPDDSRPYIVVRRDVVLTVRGTNVTDPSLGCNDTYTGGCAPEPTPTGPPPATLRDVELRLTQGIRQWSLGRADAPTGTVSYDVTLPADVRPGQVELTLVHRDPKIGGAHLLLQVD